MSKEITIYPCTESIMADLQGHILFIAELVEMFDEQHSKQR